MKAELFSVKSEYTSSSSTISNLEATIRDKERHIEMLQTQRERSGAENEEEVNRVKRAHDKLESRVASLSLSLREQLAEKDVRVVISVLNFSLFTVSPSVSRHVRPGKVFG